MKKSLYAFLFSAVIGLLATSANAAEMLYKIEVCALPLAHIIDRSVADIVTPLNLQHLFIRATNSQTGEITSFNFEPTVKATILGSKAKIGQQNYPTAKSAVIFETSDFNEFDDKLAEFAGQFATAEENYQYSIYGKNCQTVTEEILGNLGISMPEEIFGLYASNRNLQNCAQQ